jgi:hypothetical protein
MVMSDIPADGLLTWTSDVHLRTAAFHEVLSGFASTGDTATPRSLITESFRDGQYRYTFDVSRLTDSCGRVQLDLESVPWGVLAGGLGAYTVLDLGDCVPASWPAAATSVVSDPVPEPAYLGLFGLVCLMVQQFIRRRTPSSLSRHVTSVSRFVERILHTAAGNAMDIAMPPGREEPGQRIRPAASDVAGFGRLVRDASNGG